MNLIISGLALSYQWWPSLDHFLESLPEKKELSPALVEHFGEVILQALSETSPEAESRITLLRDESQADLGHYLPLLKGNFAQVEQVPPVSGILLDQIRQAADLIGEERDHHVVLGDLSRFGSAAVVLSHPGWAGRKSYAGLELSSNPETEPALADYVIPTDWEAWTDSAGAFLQQVYQSRNDGHAVALGNNAAAGVVPTALVCLIQAALAVHHKLIPAWNGPARQGIQTPDPLYINHHFRPWLSRGPDFTRSALLISPTQADQWDFLIVKETPQPPQQISLRFRPGSDPFLFLLSGMDPTELEGSLSALEGQIRSSRSLKSIAADIYTKYLSGKKAYTCCLLARNRDELTKELSHARTGIQTAFQRGQAWSSPAGSYFTPQPLGPSGTAFVYPGAFNSYPGMGRELFFSFPGLAEAAQEIIPDLSHSLAEEYLYLQYSRSPQREDQVMLDFFQHPKELIESGISISVLYTLILDQIFQLKPQAALGYSLGEASMLWANRIWHNVQESSHTWQRSSLFQDDLVGRMDAVRRYWKDRQLEADFWASYILKVDSERARAACQAEELAFLSIVNAPGEVVIAGERTACQRVIEALDCHALPMPFNAAIHNPAVQSCLPQFVELYSNTTAPREDIRFFSAADYRELTLTKPALAQSMAKMTCSPLDFPRLVEEVYQTGARLFIELGPQKTCSRWIEKILQGRPHAVVPINKRYQSDLQGILKVVSVLLSHGVSLNLAALYPARPAESGEAKPEMPQPGPADSLPGAALQVGSFPDKRPPERAEPAAAPGLPDTLFEHLDRLSADLAQSHLDYLSKQRSLTRTLARVMAMQAENSTAPASPHPNGKALFTHQQIEAFSRGDHRICFGDTFSGFGDRRIPRLPNGPMQFIDRVISIQGEAQRILEKSALTSEFDLPAQAWYRNGSPTGLSPVSLLEIALQPCGFLSAYMGTLQGRESQDLYFRNLDGEGTLLFWPDKPSGTISNRVELLSSSSLGDVIIQNYAFQLFWEGEVFYQGRSSFGYFPQAMLINQAGLDANRASRTWHQDHLAAGSWIQAGKGSSGSGFSGTPQLPEVKQLWIAPQGGKYSQGYLYLNQDLEPDAWFYHAHFFQDPVMPGSLGIETMARTVLAGAPSLDLPQGHAWSMKAGATTRWKYRGQITPDVKGFEIEIHIKNITRSNSGWQITADGQLWKESIRIYQVEDLILESH